MKTRMLVKALALSLLCALSSAVIAKHYDDDRSSHRSCDDGCAGPLQDHCFTAEIKAGVAPVIWTGRGCFYHATSIPGLAGEEGDLSAYDNGNGASLDAIGSLPKFGQLYKNHAFFVGGKIGYALCDCIEIYGEVDYRATKAKCFNLCWSVSDITNNGRNLIQFDLERYKALDGHVGFRYYTQRHWCDTTAFFIGIKAGFAYYKEIDASIRTTNSNTLSGTNLINCRPFFCKTTTVSGGGNIGLDYLFCNNWSLVFTAEFVGTGPLTPNVDLGSSTCCNDCSSTTSCSTSNCTPDCCTTVPTAGSYPATCPVVGDYTDVPLSTRIVGATFKSQVVFPITLGLKYSF